MDQSNTTEAPRFPRFAKLPPELRLHIWKYCQPPRRVIITHVIFCRRDCSKHILFEASSVPAILHACRGSRKEGLKYYEIIEDANWKPDHKASLIGKQKQAYVDLDRDFFAIAHNIDYFLRLVPDGFQNQIRYFTHWFFPVYLHLNTGDTMMLIKGIPALKGYAVFNPSSFLTEEEWEKKSFKTFSKEIQKWDRTGMNIPKITLLPTAKSMEEVKRILGRLEY